MKRVSLVYVVAVLLTASLASAATNWEREAGDRPGNWNDAINWTAFVPTGTQTGTDPVTGDPVFSTADSGGVTTSTTNATRTATDGVSIAEIQVTTAETFGQALRHGYYQDGSGANTSGTSGPLLQIMSVGSLTNSGGAQKSYIGHWSNAQMDIEAGGSFTHGHRVYLGFGAGATGIVNIAGTFDATANNLYVGIDGLSLLTVEDGGLLELKNYGNGLQIGATSIVDIEGSGMIVVASASKGNANALIAAGRIASNGVFGDVEVSLMDIEVVEHTVITAIPEPATMILLGLGGLLIRKRS